MHQLILGAAIPLSLSLLIYMLHRCRAPMWLLVLTPPAMGFCAMWAVAPDIPRIIGWHSLYEKMQIPLSDIFFWHYSIDKIEAAHLDSMTPLFNTFFALLLIALLFVAWRELSLAEKQKVDALEVGRSSPSTPSEPQANDPILNGKQPRTKNPALRI